VLWPRRKRAGAFSLVELLIVIALLGMLVGLLVPAVQKAREAANRNTCQNNLRQIAAALHNYHDDQGAFPAGYVASGPYVDGATDTSPGWGWGAKILPFLEQGGVYHELNLGLPIEAPENAKAVKSILNVYHCPSDVWPQDPFVINDGLGNPLTTVAPSSYAGCVGNDTSGVTDPTGGGVLYRNSSIRMTDVSDGTSVTILVGERAWMQSQGTWVGAVNSGVIQRGPVNPNPGNPRGTMAAPALVLVHAHLNNCVGDTDGGLDDYSSPHDNGSYMAYVDGSVRFLRTISRDNPDGSYTMDGVIFQGMATRAGGEIIPGDW
jgi:prepilin-type processing-associated H-X9-DG protein